LDTLLEADMLERGTPTLIEDKETETKLQIRSIWDTCHPYVVTVKEPWKRNMTKYID